MVGTQNVHTTNIPLTKLENLREIGVVMLLLLAIGMANDNVVCWLLYLISHHS